MNLIDILKIFDYLTVFTGIAIFFFLAGIITGVKENINMVKTKEENIMNDKLIELTLKEKIFITTVSWIALSTVGALFYYKPEFTMTFYGVVFLFLFFLLRKNTTLIEQNKSTKLVEEAILEEQKNYKYKYKNKLN